MREFGANLTCAYAVQAALDDIANEWSELHGADRQQAEAALAAMGIPRQSDWSIDTFDGRLRHPTSA
jgi:hypothetical protein